MTVLSRLLAIAVLLALAGTSLVHAAEPKQRPNVVLMMSDDQGWGETGYNGHPHLKTPVLDTMAAAGLRLDRFYAASPICTPTRASCMTGRHANRSGAFGAGWSIRPQEVTVAQLMKKAGYRTAHFGKWHIGAVKKDSPLSPQKLGFDENLSHDNFFEMNPGLSRNGEASQVIEGEGSEVLVKEALAFARKVKKEDKPFFIVIWFGSPHTPYFGYPADIAPYSKLGPNISKRFAEITAMDRAIGMFRKGLDDIGERHNTLLWFNSDNGITIEGIPKAERKHLYNGNLKGRKSRLDEGGLLVPAIIEWPAVIRTPRRNSIACVTSDILPTLIDIVGVDYPYPARPLDGISLKSMIIDGSMQERPKPFGAWTYNIRPQMNNEPWFADKEASRMITYTAQQEASQARSEEEKKWYFKNHKHPQALNRFTGGKAVWIGNQYKLTVQYKADSEGIALYDLQKDPGERTNIAEQHPDTVQEMHKALKAWQASVENSLIGADYK